MALLLKDFVNCFSLCWNKNLGIISEAVKYQRIVINPIYKLQPRKPLIHSKCVC